MKKKTLSLLGLVALSFAAFGPTKANAASVVLAPPIGSCIAPDGGELGYAFEGFENLSTTSSLTLLCSVPFTLGDDDSKLRVIQAKVTDNSTVAAATCWTNTYDVSGTIVFSGNPQVTGNAPSATGVSPLTWITPLALSDGNMITKCILPPRQGATGSQLVGLVLG